MDWIPCLGYNQPTIVPAGTQLDYQLIDPAWWNDPGEIIGRPEDDSAPTRLWRVVGQFNLVWRDNPTGGSTVVHVRLWPGWQAQDLGVGVPPGQVSDPLASNERWWWERKYNALDLAGVGDSANLLDPYNHPWWSLLDYSAKPIMVMDQQVPLLSIQSTETTADLEVTLWLRLLVS